MNDRKVRKISYLHRYPRGHCIVIDSALHHPLHHPSPPRGISGGLGLTLHPIAIVDQVLAEYRAYLATEFRASDERLRQALERALDEPRFLAQEPFFQAHRPFKDGSRWDALGLDAALAKGMARRAGQAHAYLHQSAAIGHLLGAAPSPLVVTTGTGSGKTECFLLPVIQNAVGRLAGSVMAAQPAERQGRRTR